ncbi:MAG: hypothetical protein J07HX5_00100 [halophilic archaeon J07HX5]|nr:MAG: hypothetical protein J07HX5_00100 [halophilic archaeon J07HX5]
MLARAPTPALEYALDRCEDRVSGTIFLYLHPHSVNWNYLMQQVTASVDEGGNECLGRSGECTKSDPMNDRIRDYITADTERSVLREERNTIHERSGPRERRLLLNPQ